MKPLLFISLVLVSLAARSQTRQQSMMRAELLQADSNYGKAITIYNQLLTADSTDFEVYQKRAGLYRD